MLYQLSYLGRHSDTPFGGSPAVGASAYDEGARSVEEKTRKE